MGLFNDVFGGLARLTGSIIGLPLGTLAAAFGVSERLVKRAIDAGCETADEVKEWIEENT
jgi:hypothetical protein